MTPYRIVVAESARFRSRVADSMIGAANASRVRSAPTSVIFCADLDAMASVDEVAAREARAGARSAGYLRSLRATAALFASSGGGVGGGGVGGWAQCAPRFFARSVLRGVADATGVPVPVSTSAAGGRAGGAAWAHKNTGLAAMSFLLAAASRGLAAYPMEGFDAARLARCAGFSEGGGARFEPVLVVSVGWEAPPAAGAAGAAARAADSTRPRLGQIVTVDGARAAFEDASEGSGAAT